MQLSSSILALTLATAASATSPGTDLSKSYAPTRGSCPSDVQWMRPAHGLHPSEATWIRSRKPVILDNIADYLHRLELDDFDMASYLKAINQSDYDNVPHLAFAISGGGYASAYTGIGAIRALDDRDPAAIEQRTGGLLQSLLYQTGLSGGSWPTVSYIAHDWPTTEQLVDYWRPGIARPAPGESTIYAANTTSIFTDLAAKFKAGFPVTTADYFGRAWSYELLPGVHGGVEMKFSDLINIPAFKNHQAPFPIIPLTAISPDDTTFFGLQIPFENASSYELTPYEFGGWHGDFSSFTPTAWLGTELENGAPVNKSNCVQGFDTLSFMMGSAAAAVNMWYIEDHTNGSLATFAKRSELEARTPASDLTKRQNNVVPLSTIDTLLDAFNETFKENATAVAYARWPNPFMSLNTTSPSLREESYLDIVDGSTGGQAIPLWPLIQPSRGLDFIFAWDDDEDARPNNWNNGTSLYNTYIGANGSGLPFPIVPTAATFIKNNYTHKPVFFGCDVNLTTTKDAATPIVLYLANAPYSTYSNYSFAQSMTSRAKMSALLTNSFDMLTQGNGTLDSEWAQCLGCAAIDRSVTRVGMKRTAQCQRCMTRYCWDGTSVPDQIAGPPGGRYEVAENVDLEMVLKPGVTWAEWNATSPS